MMEGNYNMRSPAVRRLMKEARELNEPTEQYNAQPLDDNLFEWHFTVRGPEDTEFDGGIYHGRIVLPPEYPMKPPSIYFLTHNGRFEIHKKICLSISGHHPESWQPSWSIRTALLAMIGFMPSPGVGAIGSLDYTKEERKKLARKSRDVRCDKCGEVKAILRPVTLASTKEREEAKRLGAQLKMEGEKKRSESGDQGDAAAAAEPQPPTDAATPSDGATPPLPSAAPPLSPRLPEGFSGIPRPLGPDCRMPRFPVPQGVVNMIRQHCAVRGVPPGMLQRFPAGFPPGMPLRFPAGFPPGMPQRFPPGFPPGMPLRFPAGFPPGMPMRFPAGFPSRPPAAPSTPAPAERTPEPPSAPPMSTAQRELQRNHQRVTQMISFLFIVVALIFIRRALDMFSEVVLDVLKNRDEL